MSSMSLIRDAEIRALDLLGDDLPDALTHLAKAAALAAGAEAAVINVITSTAQHSIASSGAPVPTVGLEDSFCAAIVDSPSRIHYTPDSRLDDRFAHSALARAGVVVTYGATTLLSGNGVPVGTLCIYDSKPDAFDESVFAVVTHLCQVAADLLETRRRHEAMADAIVELAGGTRELRRSNEHLAAFAGQVAHDVRGPLATVQMALEFVLDEAPDPVHHEMLLRRALSGARRMQATISGLMDFAQLGASLEASEVDLDGVVADVLEDLGARRGAAAVEVGDLPTAYADPVQLRAVLQNLVANAFKYAGSEPGTVIRLEGDLLDDHVQIRVTDNGPGVPEKLRDTIFDPMVRGEGTLDIEGAGIGLATCRRIVEAHGGTIGVDEARDGGATFWFELPVAPLDTPASVGLAPA